MFDFISSTLFKWGMAATTVIGVYFYIAYLNKSIDKLKADKVVLEIAITEQKETIVSLQEDFGKILKSRNEMISVAKDLQKSNDALRKTLFRENNNKKSLEEIILLDSKNRVESLINSATKEVFRCFEIVTGSKQKPKEKLECN